MAKNKNMFVCSNCDYQSHNWLGRCTKCHEWNTLEEHVPQTAQHKRASTRAPTTIKLSDVDLSSKGVVRLSSGCQELDNVLGGGIVTGSVVLLGGDPGVGKSTLTLNALADYANSGSVTLYASGEETSRQIALRAKRMGLSDRDIHLLCTNDMDEIESAALQLKPTIMVIDSVQTISVSDITSTAGSATQVRAVAQRAVALAKGHNIATFIVGHVTKSGDLAGPKTLEHFVDTVLHFEGDGRSQLRVLRAIKNRFGRAGEIGLFEMCDIGLKEVPDASARLLSERAVGAAGTAVTASLEGTRPILTEIQALVGVPGPQFPARNCVGIDRNRVTMLAAVLEKSGVKLSDRDLDVNAAGGVRLHEPAVDLAIIAAMVSSLIESPIIENTLVIGEVGLVGEVRNVSHPKLRLREAIRHGFTRIVAPPGWQDDTLEGVTVHTVSTVQEALKVLF
jgi:DNA repair protein RadA/Sms